MLPGLKQWFPVGSAYQNFLGELKKKNTIKNKLRRSSGQKQHCFKSSQGDFNVRGHVAKLSAGGPNICVFKKFQVIRTLSQAGVKRAAFNQSFEIRSSNRFYSMYTLQLIWLQNRLWLCSSLHWLLQQLYQPEHCRKWNLLIQVLLLLKWKDYEYISLSLCYDFTI